MIRRLILLALAAALTSPAAADPPQVRKVPLQSAAPEPKQPTGIAALFSKKSRRACIESKRIGGATVTGERSIELLLDGGERWRMGFKADCPALSYYQGFYYRQTQAGKLCAGRDAVLARSGAECPIQSLERIKTAKKRK